MRKYDYLIVGAGLFGAVFAHEATKCGKPVWLSTKGSTLEEIFIQKKQKESRFINTGRIFSIRPEKKSGSM